MTAVVEPYHFLPGAIWERRTDGGRIEILSEGPEWRRERQFLYRGVDTKVTRHVSISGLLRKYQPWRGEA